LIFENRLTEGDTLVVRFRMDGTHQGPFMGIPPTNMAIHLSGITMLRFEDGRCVERWTQADVLGLLQQLGALPAPAQTTGDGVMPIARRNGAGTSG
jgi:predicted ester cyclase